MNLFSHYRKSDPPRKCADCDNLAEHGKKRCPTCAKKFDQADKALRKKTTAMKRNLLKTRGAICERCSKSGKVEMHHILPVSRGGRTIETNLLLLCPDCHRQADQETKL